MQSKRFLVPLVLLLVLASCSRKAPKNLCTVDGHLDNRAFENATVLMYDYVTHELLDSAIVSHGTFSFSHAVTDTVTAYILANDDEAGARYSVCFLAPGTIYLDLENDSLSGSPANEAYNTFVNSPALRKMRRSYNDCYMAAAYRNDAAAALAIDSLAMLFSEQTLLAHQALFEANADNIVGGYAFDFICERIQSLDTMEDLLAGKSDAVRNYPGIQLKMQRLRNLDRTAVGKPYVDFRGIVGDDTVTLGSLINGQVALVDFWASWCAPCRQEIEENLIRIHDTYSDKGLLVVGVCVNDSPERILETVEDLGIPYTQMLDFEAAGAHIYGIDAIPHIMLIDKDGTILAHDLRGSDIESAVKNALK